MPGSSNRFLFQGALYEPEPQIYDMRNRFYHPNLGRFMQSDPLGFDAGDMNLFRYCGNDPVNGRDPFGLETNYEAHESSSDPSHDFDWDVRYGMTEDLLGWEAGSYIRDQFARADAASQAFAAYSAARYESSRLLMESSSFSLGLMESSESGLEGNWAAERVLHLKVNLLTRRGGRKKLYFTHYGYPGDPYWDTKSADWIGKGNLSLDGDSLAISADLAKRYKLKLGEPVYLDGQYLGDYVDRVPSPGTIDVFDPYFTLHGPDWNGNWGGFLSGQHTLSSQPGG
jgi:RHS repeat-associated protein